MPDAQPVGRAQLAAAARPVAAPARQEAAGFAPLMALALLLPPVPVARPSGAAPDEDPPGPIPSDASEAAPVAEDLQAIGPAGLTGSQTPALAVPMSAPKALPPGASPPATAKSERTAGEAERADSSGRTETLTAAMVTIAAPLALPPPMAPTPPAGASAGAPSAPEAANAEAPDTATVVAPETVEVATQAMPAPLAQPVRHDSAQPAAPTWGWPPLAVATRPVPATDRDTPADSAPRMPAALRLAPKPVASRPFTAAPHTLPPGLMRHVAEEEAPLAGDPARAGLSGRAASRAMTFAGTAVLLEERTSTPPTPVTPPAPSAGVAGNTSPAPDQPLPKAPAPRGRPQPASGEPAADPLLPVAPQANAGALPVLSGAIPASDAAGHPIATAAGDSTAASSSQRPGAPAPLPEVPAARGDQVTLRFDGEQGWEGTVRIAMRGPAIHATIVSADPEAARQMGDQLGALRRSLESQGFPDARLNIHLARPVEDEPAAAGRDQQAPARERHHPQHPQRHEDQAERHTRPDRRHHPDEGQETP